MSPFALDSDDEWFSLSYQDTFRLFEHVKTTSPMLLAELVRIWEELFMLPESIQDDESHREQNLSRIGHL